MEPLIFNKDNLRHTVWINKETAFFKVLDIKVTKGDAKGLRLSYFWYSLFHSDVEQKGHLIIDSTNDRNGKTFHIRGVLKENDLVGFNKIEFYFKETELNDNQLEIYYTTQNLNVSIEAPFQEFKAHFEESNNAKILFSAPFGQGKTTFLKEFFKNEKKRYEVFHLFPVNYAVATNEDIFRLIKTEILVKLLQNDSIEFQKEKFKYLETLPHFAVKNAHKILAPFLKAIPVVGESAFGIYEKLEEMTQSYFVEHDKLQKDDRKTAEEFIQKAYEDEGSIFEDNFYSQLIRQLIQQIKDSDKETVLIIDDTDRMDPDHIFRILNVFAAHFDTPEYSESDSNKFGFNKIIIVCDYDNLHRIFCHRFGPSADFAGYIDKFFSNHIFRYNNAEAIKGYINLFAEGLSDNQRFAFLMNELIQTNSISLRELIKQKRSEKQIQKIPRLVTRSDEVINSVEKGFIPSLRLLLFIFNKDSLVGKLKHCKDMLGSKLTTDGERYKAEFFYVGVDLVILSYTYAELQKNKVFSIKLGNGNSYDFHISHSSGLSYYSGYELVSVTQSGTEYKVEGSMELFYDLLIEVVRKL
jgi:hypothetical protein